MRAPTIPFGYWLRTPADSIEIGYPGGRGLVLRLAQSGQDLIGLRPALPVIARRVLCGAV